MRSKTVRTASVADAETDTLGASRLADALANGGWLEPRTITDAPLAPGERAYADLHAIGWRYFGLDDVSYERRTLLVGGPYVMVMAMLVTAVGNRRRRREAERAAVPQWRPLGWLRVVVTSDRLVVWHANAWWSIWYGAITQIRSDLTMSAVDLFFEADPPYRLVGPSVPALAVVLAHASSLAHGCGTESCSLG